MGSRDRKQRHGQQQPNGVHWHNQHAHGTSEGFGNFSFACSVEPFPKMEEAECKQTDQQEKVSAEDVSYFAAHAPIEPDSRVTERETALSESWTWRGRWSPTGRKFWRRASDSFWALARDIHRLGRPRELLRGCRRITLTIRNVSAIRCEEEASSSILDSGDGAED